MINRHEKESERERMLRNLEGSDRKRPLFPRILIAVSILSLVCVSGFTFAQNMELKNELLEKEALIKSMEKYPEPEEVSGMLLLAQEYIDFLQDEFISDTNDRLKAAKELAKIRDKAVSVCGGESYNNWRDYSEKNYQDLHEPSAG